MQFLATIYTILLFIKLVLSENPIRTPSLIRKQFTNCTEKDDFKADSIDCTLFHRCAYGYQYTYVCPTGTGFDSAKRVCNYVNYVPECGINAVEQVITETTEVPDYPEYPEETTEVLETTTIQILTTSPPKTQSTNNCKFKLNDLEKGIFCNSSTFRSFYPSCCA